MAAARPRSGPHARTRKLHGGEGGLKLESDKVGCDLGVRCAEEDVVDVWLGGRAVKVERREGRGVKRVAPARVERAVLDDGGDGDWAGRDAYAAIHCWFSLWDEKQINNIMLTLRHSKCSP
jgi:hypothetical protein